MNEVPIWKVPKWLFLLVNAALFVLAAVVVYKAEHPISMAIIYTTIGCVLFGGFWGCLPYILDYRAACKAIEAEAVTTVAAQLHDLKTYSAQIAAATERWALVQDATKGNTDKTVAAAKDIAARMAGEIREFNEFQVKLNDTEKGALRLEVEKLRRSEGEWLQVLARILDHIFALHNAASRSGNTDLTEQIGNFQNACRDTARRVGLLPVIAAPEEKFDPQKHRAHGVTNPAADSVVAETLAPGLAYQSRLIRPVLVRLQDANAVEPAQENTAEKNETGAPDQLALEAS